MSTAEIAFEPWVDVATAAKHLGFKPDHIRKLAKAGVLPGKEMQNGKRVYWRFKLSQIDAALDPNSQDIRIATVPLKLEVRQPAVEQPKKYAEWE